MAQTEQRWNSQPHDYIQHRHGIVIDPKSDPKFARDNHGAFMFRPPAAWNEFSEGESSYHLGCPKWNKEDTGSSARR